MILLVVRATSNREVENLVYYNEGLHALVPRPRWGIGVLWLQRAVPTLYLDFFL
jgi:hypothetical protein